ncbi:MAG TPA: tetratricopeptide repeat protein [Bryobacteraceae bacterium]|nr:tetratricopeptide repeat protein [Bryobacteraceae bacterium]
MAQRLWLVACVLVAALPLAAADAGLASAHAQYARTNYEGALRSLAAVPDKSGAAYELMGMSYYMLGEFKKASEAFEKAVELEPGNSRYHNWLGRAYGRRAELSSFLTAPGLASKARKSFEQAVDLDPGNLEAASDLFDYYLEAPGIMGGGLDKAEALANRIKTANPAENHYMLARIAEKRRQYQTAEQQFRLAAEAAPRQVGRVLDLAKFLAKRGRYQESEEAFVRAEKIAPNAPKVLFERANAYIKTGRNLEAARELLQRYLQASLTPDDPPRKDAESLLKRLQS